MFGARAHRLHVDESEPLRVADSARHEITRELCDLEQNIAKVSRDEETNEETLVDSRTCPLCVWIKLPVSIHDRRFRGVPWITTDDRAALRTASHRRRLRTTNVVERIVEKIRRRTRVAYLVPGEAPLR